jgi:coenzyme F420-reducing hydrogenase gamma subunit
VCNSENVQVLRELRANAKILVAIGACAITGGSPAVNGAYRQNVRPYRMVKKDRPTSPTSRDRVANALDGIVTLPRSQRKASAAQELSGSCDCGLPRVHRRSAKGAVRLG